MNQGGQPGQMPQGGQAQQQNVGARVQMFRPEHMRNLPQLSPDERVKYENGLRALWGSMQNAQSGSPQQMEAHKKIVDFSQQLMLKVRQRGPGSQGQQSSQASNDQGSASAESVTPAAAQTSQGPAAAPVATAQSQPSQQPAARPPTAPVPPFVKQHMDQMTFIPPQNINEQGAEAVAKWTATNKDRLQKALLQMHTTAEKVRNFDNFIKQKQQKGSLTADEQKTLQNIQAMKPQVLKAHQDAKIFVDNFRHDQTARKSGGQTAAAQGRPPSISEASNATANPPARPGPSPQQPSQTNPIDATKNQQAVAGGVVPGANGQSGQQQPQTQPQVQTQAQPQAQPQPPKAASSAAPQASPVATTQPAPGSISQPIKVEPGTQQHPPQPPPVNTAIASAAATGLPSAGTPTQNRTPQIATPTTGAPRSLSHQAALSLANQRGPQPAPIPNQTPQQGTPQGTVGTPSSAPPGVMGTAQPPTSGHPHAHPTQQPQALTQKLPIPKQLPEKAAAPPTPVSLAAGGVTPGRPTYTQGGGMAGGVMGNPVLAKLPVVQMEGEGERVLSQKKLNDLVRQVCGGQVEGQEGTPALTPDVEEAILNLADSFVDRLLHAACDNAKQRGSKVLEIRDIQLALERTYNIRIPGYSSDELRTVRKIQPAQGWITKMSAIQAAKVMPGKGDL